MRIAYIIEDDFNEKRGLMNATLNRIKYLKKIADFEVDVIAIQQYYGLIARFFKRAAKIKKQDHILVDNIRIKIIWKTFSLVDYILVYKLHGRPLSNRYFYKNQASLFRYYDLLSVHSNGGGELAYYVKMNYSIPYVKSWYGSDIHSIPFISSYFKSITIKSLKNANVNFFVSKDLLEKSNRLLYTDNKEVLYVGVRDGFKRYTEDQRSYLKERYGVTNNKVIAFVGGLVDIKNPMILPDIFKKVFDTYSGGLDFWIIGSGKLKNNIQNKCSKTGIKVKFWGYVSDVDLPDLLNCVNVLVIPSFNEGLPLVTLEALACGANVVGTRVGGISESIGWENTYELDDAFVDNIASRILQMITTKVEQACPKSMSWNLSAIRESEVYKEIVSLRK